jgi:hypothetical protein
MQEEHEIALFFPLAIIIFLVNFFLQNEKFSFGHEHKANHFSQKLSTN